MSDMTNRLAGAVMDLAIAVIRPERAQWGAAMSAELRAIPASGERLQFASGCLLSACASWTHSQDGLVWIGRGTVAAGLGMMSVIGALVALGLEPGPRMTLLFLSGVYAVGGVIAMRSLRGLQNFALVGAIAAFSACAGLTVLADSPGPSFFPAVALEAGILMVCLALWSTFLILVRDLKIEARDA
jgi:hypothetical protein